MTSPLVSILIPAYGAERWIAETLDSALAQTWPHTEVIVVDDKSRDGTLSVARRYESARVKVIAQKESQGAAAARNTALQEAQGDFIQYLDADDVLEPQKIEVQVRRLLEESTRVLATAPWGRFYNDDLSTAQFVVGQDWKDYEEPLAWLLDDWSGRGTMPPGSWLYPRDIVEEIGPWHIGLSLNDDMEFFTRAVLASEKLVFCPEARWYYRSGNASLSGRKDERALVSQYEVVRLSTERLLRAEDSQRTRHACACYWQTFLYVAYPLVPGLRREAEARVKELGGGGRTVGVSRPFRLIRDAIGWKPALHLQRTYERLRYLSPA